MTIKEEFGRAHGRSARLGGQQALAMAGKEQGIDQLGLAPRILAHEGNGELILHQQPDAALQVLRHIVREEFVHLEPAPVPGNVPDQLFFQRW